MVARAPQAASPERATARHATPAARPGATTAPPGSAWTTLATFAPVVPSHAAPPGIYRQEIDVDLVPASPGDAASLRQQGVNLPGVSPGTWRAIGGSPYATLLPGYSQEGDTCGAASLVSALIIWDREHWDPSQPNSRIVTACNLILAKYAVRGRAAVDRWVARPTPEVRRICGTDDACVREAYETVRTTMTSDLERIRDQGRAPGGVIAEADYQKIGLALYFLWHEGGRSGLGTNEIRDIQRTLGLSTSVSSGVQSFDDLFTNSVVRGLAPDQIAQAGWFTNTGAQHAFLIGRLQTGEWFLSDQGPRPAAEFRAPTLDILHGAVGMAARSGQYWLFPGTTLDYLQRGGVLPGWTGVTLLGPHTAVEAEAADLVSPGRFLGEVDEGTTTIGNSVNSGAFVARRYSLADAQAAFRSSSAGGLIVEMPSGVFSLYETTTVSDANLSQTALDTGDSSGGLLMGRSVFHAWLLLSTSSGRRGSWWRVF